MKEKVESFQLRWHEPLGKSECPYMYRWVLVLFGFSIRIHHWIRSDDKRFMHNHPWSFLTIVLKGSYTDVSGSMENPIKETLKTGQYKYRKAEHCHYVDVPVNGAWTLSFTSRHRRNWGFQIKPNQFFRPLRFFSKYGHLPCSEQ